MAAFEGAALRRFDTVIAVSARDAGGLRQRYGLAAVAAIDTGVDLEFYRLHPARPPGRTGDGGTVVFSGAMDARVEHRRHRLS